MTIESEPAYAAQPPQLQSAKVRNLKPCPASIRLVADESPISESPAASASEQDAVGAPKLQAEAIEEVPAPQGTAADATLDESRIPAEPRAATTEKKRVASPSPSAPQKNATKTAPAKSNLAPFILNLTQGFCSNAEKTPVELEVTPAQANAAAGQESTVSLRPASSSSAAPLITLHVDNLDVSKAIELISRQAKVANILVSPGVTGTVTLDIRNKTVDETLEIIARQCRLKVRRDKDIIFVTTLEESRSVEADDLPVHVYHLNYITSTDLEKIVKPLLSKLGKFTGTPESESGLKSDASKAGTSKDVESGGNALAGGDVVVIQDYEYVLKKLDRVIAELDVQPIQVLIEAVIVQVTLEKGMELGANFAVLDGASRAAGVIGSGGLINTTAGFTPASVLTAGGLLNGNIVQGLGANSQGLKFGWTGGSTTGFIHALESFGETKVLASPRVLVLNKQRADIHLGNKLGYFTTTQTQTSTVQNVQYQDIGTQLRLRPFVSSDGIIRMEIRPERSSGALDSQGIPQVNSTAITTNIMIPNGSTVVIGGLIDTEVVQTWNGFPLLARLPWVGYLFRETIDDTVKKELVVILTPHIWQPQCPERLNRIGPPRTLNLRERVSQPPCEVRRDGPTLFETLGAEGACPPENALPPDAVPMESRRTIPVRR